MTYVVTEACIKCKYMDCVEVCPVDCFYDGDNMLVIHPDECIDCGVCEPECPAEAIMPDTEAGMEQWLEVNRKVFGELAEYYPQGRGPGRCRSVEGRCRQIYQIFQPESGKTITIAINWPIHRIWPQICYYAATVVVPLGVGYWSEHIIRAASARLRIRGTRRLGPAMPTPSRSSTAPGGRPGRRW